MIPSFSDPKTVSPANSLFKERLIVPNISKDFVEGSGKISPRKEGVSIPFGDSKSASASNLFGSSPISAINQPINAPVIRFAANPPKSVAASALFSGQTAVGSSKTPSPPPPPPPTRISPIQSEITIMPQVSVSSAPIVSSSVSSRPLFENDVSNSNFPSTESLYQHPSAPTIPESSLFHPNRRAILKIESETPRSVSKRACPIVCMNCKGTTFLMFPRRKEKLFMTSKKFDDKSTEGELRNGKFLFFKFCSLSDCRDFLSISDISGDGTQIGRSFIDCRSGISVDGSIVSYSNFNSYQINCNELISRILSIITKSSSIETIVDQLVGFSFAKFSLKSDFLTILSSNEESILDDMFRQIILHRVFDVIKSIQSLLSAHYSKHFESFCLNLLFFISSLNKNGTISDDMYNSRWLFVEHYFEYGSCLWICLNSYYMKDFDNFLKFSGKDLRTDSYQLSISPHWKEVAACIYFYQAPNWEDHLISLSDRLSMENGNFWISHFLLLLSGQQLFDGAADYKRHPLIGLGLLDSASSKDSLNFLKSRLLLTDFGAYCFSLSQAYEYYSKSPCHNFQPFKLSYSMLLSELGYVSESHSILTCNNNVYVGNSSYLASKEVWLDRCQISLPQATKQTSSSSSSSGINWILNSVTQLVDNPSSVQPPVVAVPAVKKLNQFVQQPVDKTIIINNNFNMESSSSSSRVATPATSLFSMVDSKTPINSSLFPSPSNINTSSSSSSSLLPKPIEITNNNTSLIKPIATSTSTPSKSSWGGYLSSFFVKPSSSSSSPDKKPIYKADMGGSMDAHFDAKTNSWIFPGSTDDDDSNNHQQHVAQGPPMSMSLPQSSSSSPSSSFMDQLCAPPPVSIIRKK